MKNYLLIILLSVQVSLFATTAEIPSVRDTIVELKPDPQHQKSDLLIMTLLSRYHYTKPEINDTMSSRVLDKYLETLDYNKSYFLASDIEEFEKYRFELDDNLKMGKLDPAFVIFNRFIKRLTDRNDYILSLLKTEFDFTTNEEYSTDRENAKWAVSIAELDELWRKRLKNEAINEMLKEKTWEKTAETLSKRYSAFQNRMVQNNSEDVFQFFMNSFSQSIDPHTNYFSPITSENFQISMKLSLDGIGAQLRTEDEYTTVAEIVPGGPAFKSGLLKKDDKIIGVAQGDTAEMVDVIGWRLDDVVQLIRGEKGTLVRLQVLDGKAGVNSKPKEIRLVRDKVKLEEQAAKKDVIELNQNGTPFKLGIITLPAFYYDYEAQQRGEVDYKSTTRDIRKLLGELQIEKIDGLIIDLRNNGGGSLQEAIELTGLFIKDGPVVQVRNSDGSVEIGDDPDKRIVYDGPMAVLVNKFSASASEIFAGAIQDYQRGLIIGEQTYGKGTVQNLIDLNRFNPSNADKLGQLKITIAKYYRIDGGSTQNKGVVPDIPFPSAIDPEEFGESSEPTALPWDQISSADFDSYEDLKSVIPQLLEKHKSRVNQDPEFTKLIKDIEDYKVRNNKKVVSLNFEQRKKEWEEAEQKRKESTLDEANINVQDISETPEKKEAIDDPLLKETANIITDMILLSVK